MANLKEIRNRISSVSSTMQITSAMKMVSAAKLKKAQDAITAMRPYSDKLTELLQNLSASMEGDSGSRFAEERPVEKVLVIAISSNRGLAGAFNSNIVKEAKNIADTVYAGKEVHFLTIGKKANDILKKSHTVIFNDSEIFDDLTFENVEAIAERAMNLFTEGTYDKVELLYNSFKNAATQIVTREQFLPIVPLKEQFEEVAPANTTDYIFEPSKEEIVKQLIPKALKTQFFKGIRDSVASEHGARMTAMHKATDNATELRDQLKLTYNKARQAAITNEILEIVGGAEALNN
ncbi:MULTISPECIES: ATP synthase F1 subunit gamma [Leeuwenhoekiella]|uniref:ATP synthase gamma chain n=1 Tax=Leeuwenhoekiella palythoae TaxID=573501 RepID=A0A1M5VT20_9FLAO|nr:MULTISPECIES: ATP synthase F1 subunit gamma [Leeuwenhoekiella]MEC8682818.1 ATP synthase F1 subunit gamma [Bacteroidota bacterium]MEE3243067.1 ATP synthase F1 subunit gamma [Bacteroidota bacterium]RXG31055.1 ATP synthase F1 subcomplex gamma subunit [Leeuwenhoekiella palythoae]UBZ11840.1 ATP synthase F1 subunit gamma [Leeuwenhoekiella palythoae]SHH78402.1 ATP synthase F1 subcomplex gamma subunit [Leeuwenhoekiella palythoae]|tara:strand:- start:3174 stop:4049 length:876 start_codon:yes stop_codon:yes gene_type:complete